MFFFVFSTFLAYYFYAESGMIYLFRDRGSLKEKLNVRGLQVIMLFSIIFGAAGEPNLTWKLGDIGSGIMTWMTVIAIVFLCPKALRALKEYEQGLKIKQKIE